MQAVVCPGWSYVCGCMAQRGSPKCGMLTDTQAGWRAARHMSHARCHMHAISFPASLFVCAFVCAALYRDARVRAAFHFLFDWRVPSPAVWDCGCVRRGRVVRCLHPCPHRNCDDRRRTEPRWPRRRRACAPAGGQSVRGRPASAKCARMLHALVAAWPSLRRAGRRAMGQNRPANGLRPSSRRLHSRHSAARSTQQFAGHRVRCVHQMATAKPALPACRRAARMQSPRNLMYST